jgi:hypothetical protein
LWIEQNGRESNTPPTPPTVVRIRAMRPPVIASSRINAPLDARNTSRSAIANKTSHAHTQNFGLRFSFRVLVLG